MAIGFHDSQGGAESATWVHLDQGGFISGGLRGYPGSGLRHQVWAQVNEVKKEVADTRSLAICL